MKSILAALALLAALVVAPRPAVAGEVEDRAARLKALESQRVQIDAERQKLERQFAAMTAEVKRLKAQRPSWNQERKLKQRLADSQEMARALDARQDAARALDRRIVDERKALVAAIDRELRAARDPARAQLARLRAEHAARLPRPARKLRTVDVGIDPLDDPEDLELKAGELAQNEAQIESEMARLDNSIRYYRRMAKLEKSRQRSTEIDVFRDDQPRRRTGSSEPVVATAEGRTDGVSPASPPATGGPTDDGDYADPGESGSLNGGAEPVVSDVTTVELSTVYSEVVEAGTLDELRRAERSRDPAAQARAAARARADLAKRAAELRKRRLEMEQRARLLRETE